MYTEKVHLFFSFPFDTESINLTIKKYRPNCKTDYITYGILLKHRTLLNKSNTLLSKSQSSRLTYKREVCVYMFFLIYVDIVILVLLNSVILLHTQLVSFVCQLHNTITNRLPV